MNCDSILDGWTCTEGDDTKPSECSKGSIAESEQMVASAVATAKATAAVSAVSSISSLFSLGPGLFMLIHLQSILSTLVLIGNHTNQYVVKVL